MKKIWLLSIGYWVVMAALCCWLYPITVYDSTARYAPMADAFARGDWFFAWHPRFGVFFMTLAGVLSRILGLNGDHACQVVSTFFLAFSAIPVYSIVSRVFDDEKTALISVVLTLIATEYFVYAQDGLRDTTRIFGLAMCVLGCVSYSAWPMSLGVFCLVTLRTDLFLISGAILFAWYVWIVMNKRFSLSKVCPAVVWTVGANLMCLMTWCYTGIWVPGQQFVKLYLKFTGGAL